MIGSSVFTAAASDDDRAGLLDERRLRAVIDAQADFVWRTLRRLGLPPDAAEDAAQRVFIALSGRIGDVTAGAEQAFLFRTAVHVASRARRGHARRREELRADPAAEVADAAPSLDEILDRRQAQALLERALEGMELDARAVFILFELEGKSTADIAAMLDVPMGTVASRLRRARADFDAFVRRIEARAVARPGGGPR